MSHTILKIVVILRCTGYHNWTTLLKKPWTNFLCRFKYYLGMTEICKSNNLWQSSQLKVTLTPFVGQPFRKKYSWLSSLFHGANNLFWEASESEVTVEEAIHLHRRNRVFQGACKTLFTVAWKRLVKLWNIIETRMIKRN